jgi:hypothetical protein
VSRLNGVLRTPAQPVVGARVRLICPWGVFKPEMRVVGSPSPAITNGRGEFEVSLAGFESVDEACLLRVERDGQPPFEAALSSLPHRSGPEARTTHARLVIER